MKPAIMLILAFAVVLVFAGNKLHNNPVKRATYIATHTTSVFVGGASSCVSGSNICQSIPKPGSCHNHKNVALPDPKCTPGLFNHSVTQRTIGKTICVPGWTATIRPSTSYTEPIKYALMRAYGYGTNVRDYELDHLIPLELGGDPTSIKNLWPEPHNVFFLGKKTNVGSFTKDGWENSLRAKVCNGTMKLAAARKLIKAGWINGYK